MIVGRHFPEISPTGRGDLAGAQTPTGIVFVEGSEIDRIACDIDGYGSRHAAGAAKAIGNAAFGKLSIDGLAGLLLIAAWGAISPSSRSDCGAGNGENGAIPMVIGNGQG